ELAKQLNIGPTIRFLGQRRDLPSLLPCCDLFVLSSISEGLSFAILEAMAAGLPIVATRVGGNCQLVEDGINGLLVNARDPSELGLALRRLLEDSVERLRMGREGRRTVEQNHDSTLMARRYLDLYARLLDGKRRTKDRVRVASGTRRNSCALPV